MKKTKPGSKKRKSKRKQVIVLADGAGNFYEIPRATLERARATSARKAKIAAELEDKDVEFGYIGHGTIPGSTGVAQFKGGRQLHYHGFYLCSSRAKP